MGIILGWGGIGIWLGMVLSPLLSGVILMVRFYQEIANKIANSDDGEQSMSKVTVEGNVSQTVALTTLKNSPGAAEREGNSLDERLELPWS
jgi:MATE family multidrug resistance protein